MYISEKDREILRQIANEYMQAASLDTQKNKMELWKSFNRGDKGRGMVIIDQLPWNELNNLGELTCKVENPFFKGIEWNLRSALYKWKHFPADMVLEPYITIGRAITGDNFSIQTDTEYLGAEDSTAKSQHYNDIITEEEDVQKIKDMDIKEDETLSLDRFNTAKDIFSGIAPVVMGHGLSFHLGVWDKLSTYMGVENIYCDLLDRPEFLHACMRRITDATIAGIKKANELKLHDDIVNVCHCSYTYTDDLLPDFGKGLGSTSENCWSMGLAQLFSYVSPKVTAEFELPYITEMANYFGKIYYGCCDRIDDRLDIIFKIPKVKKLSCSPWCDKENFMRQLEGTGIIISVKPNPAFIAGVFDEDIVRKDLRESFSLGKQYNVNTEVILKDISTAENKPERLTRWAEIAMEEAAR